MKIDWKARLENKAFIISFISAIILLSQQLGFDAAKIIPNNYVDIINTVFVILSMLGIVVDPSTDGVNDNK